MADLPSILGGLAQGFVDFGKGAVDMFGTGGAAIGDLIEGARTGKVTTKNQDDFRKWLYQTDSTKDAAAKGLGTALNGVQTVLDYIPGVNVLTRNPLGNAAQGALGGLADEFKTYGADYDLGRAGQRAAISGAAAAASGSLADALKGSSNALLSSNTLQGLARGATGGAITGGGYAAIDGGDVLEAAKQGAGMGALIGGATGAFQDFAPRKSTYNAAMTDEQRQARIANIDDQLSKLDTSTPEGSARYNELISARNNYADNIPTARTLENAPSENMKLYRGISAPDDATLQRYIDEMKDPNIAPTTYSGGSAYGQGYYFTPDEGLARYYASESGLPSTAIMEIEVPRNRFTEISKENGNRPADFDLAAIKRGVPEDIRYETGLKDFNDYLDNNGYWGSRTSGENPTYTIMRNDAVLNAKRIDAPSLETTLSDADMAVNNPRYLTDENGNPRTFYHGSPNKNITEFDINQAGKNTSSGERALYFTDSPEVADEFSYERLPSDSMFVNNRGAKGRVYPVNLAMDNPLDLSNLSDKQIEELWQYASPLGKLDGKEKFIKNMKAFRDYGNDQLIKTNLDLDKLANSQYDGFTARMYPNQANQAREYAVFDNSKVKMLEDVLANDDMAVNNQANGLGGSPDGAQNYRTFATGDEAREYFGNSNPGYWDKAPGYDDIQEYTRNGYSRVNDMLRTGQDNYGYPDTDIMIDNIERGIDGYNLKDDIKVYRKSNADVYKNLKVGDTFTDDGFTSASVTPEIGGDFGKANIEIDVGKGKGVGAFIGDLSSGNGDEGEFLLQRGTKYKVVGKDGDKLKLEVVGNERKPLEQILANQDLSVNSAKIAPGQLGLFDDMPTQTPKTGTRQTSLFDQPDNPYLDYYGADIDATPLAPETPVISGPVDMSVEDLTKMAIDESTLPKGWKKAQELANMGKRAKQIVLDSNDPNRAQNEYNVALYSDSQYNRNMPVADVIDKLGQIQYGREVDRGAARLLADQLDESGDEFAKKFVTGAAEIGGNISHYRDAPKARLADEQLSDLLNIGRSSSMLSDSLAKPTARNARGDQWKGTINLDGKSIAKGSDGGISTFGHERLHAFQDAGNMGYDQRVVDAYNELHDDLSKIYHSDSQIRKDYGSDVKYWSKPIEQEARMAQFYLEDKFGVKGAQRVPERDANGKAIRYKDDGTIADPNNLLDYYAGKPAYKGEFEGDRKAINAAFDKFRGKLQDLTRKGVALPAFLTLFGGGAYMASQENDKEKEVK